MLAVNLVGVDPVLAGITGFDIEDVPQRDLAEDLRSFTDHRPDDVVEADLSIGEEGIPQVIGKFNRCFRFFFFGTKKIADQIDNIVHSFLGQAELTQEDPDE